MMVGRVLIHEGRSNRVVGYFSPFAVITPNAGPVVSKDEHLPLGHNTPMIHEHGERRLRRDALRRGAPLRSVFAFVQAKRGRKRQGKVTGYAAR